MNNPERWRAVVGYEGSYEVSDLGRVRSLDRVVPYTGGTPRRLRGRALLCTFDTHGYPSLCLHADGGRVAHRVHQLVLRAFVGAPGPGMEGRHLDGNRSRSCLENLEWSTHVENMADMEGHETLLHGEKHSQAKLKIADVRAIRNASGTQASIAKRFGVSRGHVGHIKAGDRWSRLA